jgi:outer membrane translocation and assembly module TamA
MAGSRRSHTKVVGFALWSAALLCLFALQTAQARILPSAKARAPKPAAQRASDLPSDAELESAGARIGEIRFDARQLFDAEAEDEDTTLTRLANRLHVQTRETTIADQLLFKSGDPYRPSQLEESARILRDTRYLRDATIRPVAFHDGVVDIEVTTQDVWTFNPGISFGRKGGKNSSGFELEELNFLGTGTQLGVGFKSEVDRDSKFVRFRDRQLGSSWWDLATTYSDNSDGRQAEFSFERPFYALDTRWAAGISALDEERTDSRYDLGEITDQFATHEKQATVYWGRSAGLRDGWARRLSFGLTYDDLEFGPASGEAAPLLLPGDRKLVYPWIGAEWVEDAFRTARNRDQIEKTEDYSLGWHARAQLGYASSSLGSDRNALMVAGSVSKGLLLTDRQSFFFGADAGGRLESGALAGSLLSANARYYFRQSPRRVLVMNLSATAGANLDVDQQILLGGDNGLRGYPLRYQAGEGRWLFTAEQRLFSNWYPFQMFNVGGAVFYDMGATWGRDALGSSSQGLLRDVGFGLRFGNSRSALGNVLHVDVAYPLDGDSSARKLQFIIETRKSF